MKRLRTLRALLPISALTLSWTLMAQGQGGNQTQAPASYSSDPLVQSLKWRNIGNANLVGRISAIDALESDFAHVVVGSASGGVFKSTNAGSTWTAIFDNYGSASIGDVAIHQKNPNIIWVGTGEECGRNSAAWGDGVYKSTDGGKTFTHMGLKESFNIGSITLHPTDPNIAYVAAVGSIYRRGGERGFYKTIDGGKTWTKLTSNLPAEDGWTGAIEARMDPTNPNILYVGFWERKRTAWNLDSGGANGGVFKTTDGGKTFKKLTKGLPTGKTGKIGLAVSRSNPKVVMAHIEAEYQPAANTPEFTDMSKIGAGIYRSEDGGETWTFMNRYNRRPFYYNHVAISPFNDKETYHYNISFDRSTDGGKTLNPTGRGGGGGGGGGGGFGGGQPSTAPQGSGMHCWHAIWLDPHNKKRFWIGSDGGLALTHDDGETYLRFENLNVTQYYDVAVDMREPYWVCGGLQDAGSSCGPSATRATAIYTSDWVNTSGGDGYHAAMDPIDHRTVYTESQPGTSGGNIVRFDRATGQSTSIRPRKGVNIVNYDAYITPEIEKRQLDRNWGEAPPPPPPGQRGGGGRGGGGGGGGRGATMGAFRWNWSTPFVLSEFNSRTLYVGSNHVFKSTDRGDTWRVASPDLTKNDPEKTLRKSGGLTPDEDPGGGAEFYGTIVTVMESPLTQGEIWVGTDDGNVQVSRNDGATWEEVGRNMQGLPSRDLYISRVEPSHHTRGTAYVSIDGHEAGIFKPFVYKTADYGKTWTNISGNLPEMGPVYVVTEDHKNANLLFVGTEFAVHYSADGGKTWAKLNNNMPTVAVHDLVIHPRDNDLIAGTHGRGIWIMDDITPLQQLSDKVKSAEAHLFQNRAATQWLRLQPHGTGGSLSFRGENPTRNAVVNYYLGSGATGQVRFEISDVAGENKRTLTVSARPGINRLEWPMTFDPSAADLAAFQQQQQAAQAAQAAGRQGGGGGGGGGGRGRGGFAGPQGDPAGPGEYRVTMTVNGKTYTSKLTVREDPLLDTLK